MGGGGGGMGADELIGQSVGQTSNWLIYFCDQVRTDTAPMQQERGTQIVSFWTNAWNLSADVIERYLIYASGKQMQRPNVNVGRPNDKRILYFTVYQINIKGLNHIWVLSLGFFATCESTAA